MSEIAWAAGLFDGEGSIFVSKRMRCGRPSVRLGMAVAMTTPETVHRFHAAVGMGSILGPYDCGPRRKPKVIWRAGPEANIRAVVALLWAYLSEPKRRQAIAALAERDEFLAAPLPWADRRKTHCHRGHDLSVTRYRRPHSAQTQCKLCMAIAHREWEQRKRADCPMFTEVSAA